MWFFPQTIIYAQKLDVAYVPTPYSIVERMLEVSYVGPGDYVIDLGSGDGRIVIAAAKRGAFAHGIDLDPKRIAESRKNAREAGVADKVLFIEENIYETDFSRANVITMYLFPTINIKLRPFLLEKLKPGSRVVSHDFSMDEWKADKHIVLDNHHVFFWIVPAMVKGKWTWNTGGKEFTMTAGQEYQEIQLDVLSGGGSVDIEHCLLKGERISFSAMDASSGIKYIFSGLVEENEIVGIVQIHDDKYKTVEKWTAVRK